MAGLASAGVDVLLLRRAADPGRRLPDRRARRRPRRDAHRASHNPMPDNGIKFLARGGRQARRRRRARDRAAPRRAWDRPLGGDVGRVTPYADAVDEYVAHLVGTLDRPLDGHQGRPRLRPRRGVRRRAARAARGRRRGDRDPRRARRPQHQRRLRLHPPRAAAGGGARARRRRRLRARRRRRPLPGGRPRRATSSTATRSWRSSRSAMAETGHLRQEHRRRDRDEQPRLRAGDAGRRHRRAPDQGRRPLRPRGDAGLRLLASAASSPAT